LKFYPFEQRAWRRAGVSDVARHADLPDAIAEALASRKGLFNFAPTLAARFETDTRIQRGQHLRRMIWLGVLISNVYNISGFVTAPDLGWLNLGLRVLVLTPIAFALSAIVARVSDDLREKLCALGMIGTTGIPMLLFLLSSDPLAPFTTAEIILCVLFANTTLALRFPWACFVSATVTVALFLSVCLKPELGWGVAAAIMLNLLTAVIYSLAANYRIERAERRDYLLTLSEALRVDVLTADNDALAQLSTTDALTGLSNRRALEDRTPALDRAIDQGRPLAVIILDVDHFKAFNDCYGHGAGDDTLRRLSAVFRVNRRDETDMVVRYGGEEFIIVLQDRTAAQAETIADRLRRAVEMLDIPHASRGDEVPYVTISLGVAASDLCPGLSLASLIARADAALYEAKSGGRNRVCGTKPTQGIPSDKILSDVPGSFDISAQAC
jgi:diguanylate cyclase (GGDEF)-like protein